jgi:YopX protein
MQRKILFRAKKADGSGWLYGHYCILFGRHMILNEIEPQNSGAILPETLGQWTGIVGYFEGDIIEVPEDAGIVVFKGGCFMIEWINDEALDEALSELLFIYKTGLSRKTIKFLGNIHDNPELITHHS